LYSTYKEGEKNIPKHRKYDEALERYW